MKCFHPYLAYKNIDWDAALIKAIPHVKAARTPAEYRAAIAGLLQELGDPSTSVQPVTPQTRIPSPGPNEDLAQPTYFHTVDGYVVITATDWARALLSGNSIAPKQAEMFADIAKGKGIIIDCRYAATSPASGG